MLLIAFPAVDRPVTFWLEWYLIFFSAVCTRDGVHFAWSAVIVASSSKSSISIHFIPPYTGSLFFKEPQVLINVIVYKVMHESRGLAVVGDKMR